MLWNRRYPVKVKVLQVFSWAKFLLMAIQRQRGSTVVVILNAVSLYYDNIIFTFILSFLILFLLTIIITLFPLSNVEGFCFPCCPPDGGVTAWRGPIHAHQGLAGRLHPKIFISIITESWRKHLWVGGASGRNGSALFIFNHLELCHQ